jgi:hypothetical protein
LVCPFLVAPLKFNNQNKKRVGIPSPHTLEICKIKPSLTMPKNTPKHTKLSLLVESYWMVYTEVYRGGRFSLYVLGDGVKHPYAYCKVFAAPYNHCGFLSPQKHCITD